MGEYAEADFVLLCGPGGGAQGRSEQPFVAAEGAFDLPALAVVRGGKVLFHLPPIRRGGQFVRARSVACGDDARGAQLVADQRMDGFGVVAGIEQRLIEGQAAMSLAQDRRRFEGVAARSQTHVGRQQQMRTAIADGGKLGPMAHQIAFSATHGEIAGNVPGLESRGVPGDLRPLCDQAAGAGMGNDAIE